MTGTLGGLIDDAGRAWPDRVAVGDAGDGRSLTYRQLAALVEDLATQLSRHGVGRGDCVAVLSDNCVEYAPALLAIAEAGAAAAPLDPRLVAPKLLATLERLDARAAIIPVHLSGWLAETHPTVASRAWTIAVAAGGADLTGPPVEPAGRSGPPASNDIALRMLTSGTTAQPKVVPLTHANVLASIHGIGTVYRLTPDDATLAVMPLFHGHGLMAALLGTLAAGGACWMPSGGRFHAGRFWPDMAASHATWYTAVPTIHKILLARAASDYPKEGYQSLRFVRSCSAALAPSVLRELETTFDAPVLEAYGMTETAHQVTSNPLPSDGPEKPSSVGVATGAEIQIARLDGTVAPAGETGEVSVRGATVASGYLGDARATAESFTDGWFHSGDLGHQDQDGYLFLTGRVKDIINRGGEKISPAAVDEVLESNPNVEEALSCGVPDQKYGEEIYAGVVLRPGRDMSEDDLEGYASSRLSAFEVPKRIFFLTDLPRTAKGSGDRRHLAALLARKE